MADTCGTYESHGIFKPPSWIQMILLCGNPTLMERVDEIIRNAIRLKRSRKVLDQSLCRFTVVRHSGGTLIICDRLSRKSPRTMEGSQKSRKECIRKHFSMHWKYIGA